MKDVKLHTKCMKDLNQIYAVSFSLNVHTFPAETPFFFYLTDSKQGHSPHNELRPSQCATLTTGNWG